MRREKGSVAGHIILINLITTPAVSGHLRLDQVLAMLPCFEAERSCMHFESRLIHVSVLHPSMAFGAVASHCSAVDLTSLILRVQHMFGCLVIFCCPGDVERAVADLLSVVSRLRCAVIFAPDEVGPATANLGLALRAAALHVVDRVVTAKISIAGSAGIIAR
jgi:hypothetical protein